MRPRSAILIAALGFGLLSAGLMALRIMWEGETWHERTFWIVAISGFGGLVGSPMTLGVMGFLDRRLGNLTPKSTRLGGVTPAILASLGFALAWLGASALLFVFHNRVLAGQYEVNEARPILSFFFSSLQTLGLYIVSIPRYALPWVLPALMLAAAIALPRLLRRSQTSPDQPNS